MKVLVVTRKVNCGCHLELIVDPCMHIILRMLHTKCRCSRGGVAAAEIAYAHVPARPQHEPSTLLALACCVHVPPVCACVYMYRVQAAAGHVMSTAARVIQERQTTTHHHLAAVLQRTH
jgi:hypothetical protein